MAYPDGSGWQRPGFDRSALVAGISWAELRPSLRAAAEWNHTVFSRERGNPEALQSLKILRALDGDSEPGPALNGTFPPMPSGWSRKRWAERLQQMANTCERDHPQRAAELRAWAQHVYPPPATERPDGS